MNLNDFTVFICEEINNNIFQNADMKLQSHTL